MLIHFFFPAPNIYKEICALKRRDQEMGNTEHFEPQIKTYITWKKIYRKQKWRHNKTKILCKYNFSKTEEKNQHTNFKGSINQQQ